ncbi:MAG: glutamine-hydrolyzing carbamoyl-phosphate synthase small subunit [Bacteriovoracia bacterium]
MQRDSLKRSPCRLTLATGDSFEGWSIGAPLRSSGELVFTTGMVGYAETLTDPSYYGQVLVFAYPMIGNYGVPENTGLTGSRAFESERIHASAVVVHGDCTDAFHWRSLESLDEWLRSQNCPGIVGVDTRQLVHIIRGQGTVLARIEPEGATEATAFYSRDGFYNPTGTNLLPSVSRKDRVRLGSGNLKLAVIDCGVKWNIVRQLLSQADCEIELLPWDTDFSTVDCDAWILSNGPGDPVKTGDLVARVRVLLSGTRPVLGICLGHQIMALASGGRAVRMPYGHRSHNQPVRLTGTDRGFMTSQNHGFVIEHTSATSEWETWFENVNDGTIEGIKHRTKPFRSVQFHPEAAGGPRDTEWIVRDFVEEARTHARASLAP